MTQYCQRNPEDKNKLRGITLPRLQAILQSNSLQNNVVLAQKQTYQSMDQKRAQLVNPPTHSPSCLGKLDSHMEINEIRTHPHTIHNNELKILKDLNPDITPYKF